MICKGCNKDKKLIKAHVIPEAFWIGLREGNTPPKLITNRKGVYPKRLQIGVYDKNILCLDCEQKFQRIDDYAQKLLLKEVDKQEKISDKREIAGYKIPNFDYHLLKLFFISILWRASVSKRSFYSRVNIGPFERRAKQIIWENSTIESEEFSSILAKFTNEDLGLSVFDPIRERIERVNYYRFYFFGYILYIKVDKRPTPDFFKPLVIQEGSPLMIVGRDINKSKEYPLMLDVVKNSKN